jgi:nucleoside-diphosphate-sugar epimerase
MRLLVLGGTDFVGRAVAEAALESGGPDGFDCAKVCAMNPSWEERVAAAWAAFDTCPQGRAHEFRALIDTLVAELPDDSPLGLFERACAWDSTGHSDEAVPLYREALARGLDGYRGRRARIQLASSLRNTGQAEEGVKLLTPELEGRSDELDDAVRAVLALCLSSLGRDREGLSLVLGALSPHLPRYQRSMANYARALVEPEA